MHARISIPKVFDWLKGIFLKTKKFLYAVILYTILILIFSLLYKAQYASSVLNAKEILQKRAKETAWIVGIRLYQLIQQKINEDGSIEWKSSMSLGGIKENLAFIFLEAEDFLADPSEFGGEITVAAYLTCCGGPITKYGTPYYSLRTSYFWYPKYRKRHDYSKASKTESNRFYGTRTPYEWAPLSVFDNAYELPFKTINSERVRIFSVSNPRSVFLEECAEEIEMYLQIFIAEEIYKWQEIGALLNFLYFSCTFGLGDIAPNSARVRHLLTLQVFLGTVILVIIIPGLLSKRDLFKRK